VKPVCGAKLYAHQGIELAHECPVAFKLCGAKVDINANHCAKCDGRTALPIHAVIQRKMWACRLIFPQKRLPDEPPQALLGKLLGSGGMSKEAVGRVLVEAVRMGGLTEADGLALARQYGLSAKATE
jgi:hypothetical protein